MKLKQVLEAYAAIHQLIAADKANKWVLSSATRIKLAGNLRRAKVVQDDFVEERNKLIEKHGALQPDGSSDVGKATPEERKAFQAAHHALTETESDFTPSPITKADLCENQIAIDVLAVLLDTGLLTE